MSNAQANEVSESMHSRKEKDVLDADVFIVGGGLAGLSLSIQLARAGYKVMLAEKGRYPFHRVCGEYISMESWDFLEGLGLPLSQMDLPRIQTLTVSSPNGRCIDHPLDLGGFGISRYALDAALAALAKSVGVNLMEDTKVQDIIAGQEHAVVDTSIGPFKARVACGSFGKRSNLDIKWKRHFAMQKAGALNNYIGVKYHIDIDFPKDRIALHNFANGYCGISAVEKNVYCLCYLTTAENLRRSGGSIAQLEKNLLSENPHLKKIFSTASFRWPEPLTISQISFERKAPVQNHILFCGDAAGMITPLCGNGMSMAMHGSKILADHLSQYFSGNINRENMEKQYARAWEAQFSGRMRMGRMIQSLFGKKLLTNAVIATLKPFPFMTERLIRATHGQRF